jgi:hypothetical protein
MSVDPVFTKALPSVGVMLLGIGCGMRSMWLFDLIRAEVNAKLPEAERISPWDARPFLVHRILTAHREMYPESKLRTVMNATVLVGITSAVVLAFLIVVLGP